jgi:hypothetical protein
MLGERIVLRKKYQYGVVLGQLRTRGLGYIG